MKEFTYTIQDENGIHARPAGLIVQTASKFASDITIENGGKTADAKKIFALMSLGVKKDNTIKIVINGGDEENAASEIESLLKENL